MKKSNKIARESCYTALKKNSERENQASHTRTHSHAHMSSKHLMFLFEFRQRVLQSNSGWRCNKNNHQLKANSEKKP